MTVPAADSFPPGRPWPGEPVEPGGAGARWPAVPARPARSPRPPGAGLAGDTRLARPGPGTARLPGRAALPGLDRPG